VVENLEKALDMLSTPGLDRGIFWRFKADAIKRVAVQVGFIHCPSEETLEAAVMMPLGIRSPSDLPARAIAHDDDVLVMNKAVKVRLNVPLGDELGIGQPLVLGPPCEVAGTAVVVIDCFSFDLCLEFELEPF